MKKYKNYKQLQILAKLYENCKIYKTYTKTANFRGTLKNCKNYKICEF